jgi:hypothetical protein
VHDADADAERLDLGDEHSGQVSTGDRAHAADHDDHESVADHGEVHQQVGRLARDLQCAAEPGEEGAEREHGGEQDSLVDAERADHLAVLRGGAHQPAEPRLGERDVKDREHDRAERDEQEVVARKTAAEDLDRAAQAGRARAEQVLRSPQPQHRVVDHQHQREGREQLEQLRRLVDAAKENDLDQRADHGDHQRRSDDAAPEAEPAADLRGEAVGEIDAQHVERAVRDIDDARDAEDQRQAGRDEEQPRCRRQPVEGLEQECVEGHRAVVRLYLSAGASPLPACGERSTREARRVRGHLNETCLGEAPSPALAALGHPLPASGERVARCNASSNDAR